VVLAAVPDERAEGQDASIERVGVGVLRVAHETCSGTLMPRRESKSKRAMWLACQSMKGLKVFTAAGKSAVLRVTTVSCCISAVAAMRLSITSILKPLASCVAYSLPQNFILPFKDNLPGMVACHFSASVPSVTPSFSSA
jgi:hypothetical protein